MFLSIRSLKKETLTTKLESIEKQLKDLKADRRESERDTKFAETLANLKKLFPGVHGRMSELCKPREKKYYPAVSIVMAANFDAVVVDDEKVAKDCIEVRHGHPLTAHVLYMSAVQKRLY